MSDDRNLVGRAFAETVAKEPPHHIAVERVVASGRQRERRQRYALSLAAFSAVAVAAGGTFVLNSSSPPDQLAAATTPAQTTSQSEKSLEESAKELQDQLRSAVSGLLPGDVVPATLNWSTTQTSGGPSGNLLASVTWRDAEGGVTITAMRTAVASEGELDSCTAKDETASKKKCKTVPAGKLNAPVKAFTPTQDRALGRIALKIAEDNSTVRVEQQAGIFDVTGDKPGESFGVQQIDKRPSLPLTDAQLAEIIAALQ